MVLTPCADPGIFARGSRPDCHEKALTTFIVLYFKENYNVFKIPERVQYFQGGGGVQHFSRGSNFFQRGGGGV